MTDPLNGRWAYRRPRHYTNKLLEAMDDGILDPKGLAESLLLWMSEDDVKEFYERYGLEELDEE